MGASSCCDDACSMPRHTHRDPARSPKTRQRLDQTGDDTRRSHRSWTSCARVGSELSSWLGKWAGNSLAGISYSGSYAKGTAVAGTTAVDLFISPRADTNGTLEEVHGNLFQAADANGWSPSDVWDPCRSPSPGSPR
jgi:hypothetical protein